ncbi:DUF6542 domain-containing protein [Streptacidiphilus melanogenes]|uniref:DUF6542 domain-containing protein n=1 Tax=Streptacidiphilus melanogenes TaxID=411235 RepID=UPI001269B25E|nr:DUF6542 domain-containing protein [Streptacidiphilus melanogenes]
MEYRTSRAQPGTERNMALPKPARSPEALVRPARPVTPNTRGPQRLTAIGCGLLLLVTCLAAGALDSLLFDSSGVLLGLVYIAASFQASVKVRSSDLAAAPISGPICFALALLFFGPDLGPGWGGHVIGLAEALALDAGWLFAGTGLSVAIAVARHFSLSHARKKAQF